MIASKISAKQRKINDGKRAITRAQILVKKEYAS
jgi:hypothetical protein